MYSDQINHRKGGKMRYRKLLQMSIGLALVSLPVVACGTPQSTSTPVPPTATPAPTATTIATPTPVPPTEIPPPTPVNLLTIIEQYAETINQQDIPALLGLLADDVEVTILSEAPYWGEEPLQGLSAVQSLFEFSRATEVQLTLSDCQQSEHTVTCEATENNLWLQASEFEEIRYQTYAFKFDDTGAIQTITLEFDSDSDMMTTWTLFNMQWWAEHHRPDTVSQLLTPDDEIIFSHDNGVLTVSLVEESASALIRLADLLDRAEMHYQSGEYEQAIAAYTEILSLSYIAEMTYEITINRADAYDDSGQQELAIEDYLAAIELTGLELDDVDPDILNNLCWDYALTMQPELGLPYCEKAVELGPDAAHFVDSRGLTYALLGDLPAAIADFQVVVDDLAGSSDPYLQTIRTKREKWISALQAGQNPFTPKVLNELRYD
jgi:tetratricopeptide (TPR) repeat protein